jgi:hypothetical protein
MTKEEASSKSIVGSDANDIRYGIRAMQRAAHALAVAKGWYSPRKTFTEAIALIHSEISEALEEYRNGNLERGIYYGENGKPEGVDIELADAVIRIMDLAEDNKIDLGEALLVKHKFNMTREFRHGGKKV